MKRKSKYPLKSYCGKVFEQKRWGRHLTTCGICEKQYQIYVAENETKKIDKPCECGCGGLVKNGGRFLRGHYFKTDEGRGIKSEMWKNKNPMDKIENRKYGDDNPAKRPEIREKISINNPMKNETYKKLCVENRKKVGYETTISLNKTLWKDKNLLERRVKTYCENLASGKIKLKNNWSYGYHVKKDGTREWYDSSYELKRMIFYDDNNIIWTKKHNIKIPYVNEDGLNTYYVPDFLITLNGEKTIEEIKGWIKKNDLLKVKCGIEYCKKNGLNYFFYLGSDLKLITENSYKNGNNE